MQRGQLKYTEKEFLQRKPLPKYETMKALETMCIAAGRAKDRLKTFVICSGILYGNGEDVFYDHFKVYAHRDHPMCLIISACDDSPPLPESLVAARRW